MLPDLVINLAKRLHRHPADSKNVVHGQQVSIVRHLMMLGGCGKLFVIWIKCLGGGNYGLMR